MSLLDRLKIKIFVDCADFDSITRALALPIVTGITTNPSLVSQAGVSNYTAYAQKVLQMIPGSMPVSFEVFSDAEDDMAKQARIIHSWGKNVYVKIPVVSAAGESRGPLIRKLSGEGIPLNVTAVFTAEQTEDAAKHLAPGVPALVSVFAGRMADVGTDPVPVIRESREILRRLPSAALLWASTRELYNIFEADAAGCQVITAPLSIISKLSGVGKDLIHCSIDAVRAFMSDIEKSGVAFGG